MVLHGRAQPVDPRARPAVPYEPGLAREMICDRRLPFRRTRPCAPAVRRTRIQRMHIAVRPRQTCGKPGLAGRETRAQTAPNAVSGRELAIPSKCVQGQFVSRVHKRHSAACGYGQ
jgi:hypothetical protein